MLLSICIPTKNRAPVLRQSLESLTSQDIFTSRNDIEIVISDNASDDNTSEIVKPFLQQYQGKIRYERNMVDVADANFEQVLRHGRGKFLKLANDSLRWLPDSLSSMIQLIEAAKSLKPTIFFLNQSRQTSKTVFMINGVDELLKNASYSTTWIGGFGIWKDHLDEMPDFSRYSSLQLPQVDALLRLVRKTEKCILSNMAFCQIIPTGPKGGYNIAEVFGVNYLYIINQFADHIKKDTIDFAKKDVLQNHIIPFHLSEIHNFREIDIEKSLPNYAEETYFKSILSDAREKSKRSRQQHLAQQAPLVWRQRNPHNETIIKNFFNFDKVTVGKATYGPLHIYEWGHPDEQLTIGHYVSIADGVTFLLGGNHPYDGVTTFPVKVKYLGYAKEATTKGAIIVGDDVWLGHNALIMSGVKIGQGAVVAAGAVVTKNVPAYSIVAGNPARVVKYRFAADTIKKLMQVNYAAISPEKMAEIGLDLYENSESPAFAQVIEKLVTYSSHTIAP